MWKDRDTAEGKDRMRRWLVRYFVLAALAIAALMFAIWRLGELDMLGLSQDGLIALLLTVGFTAVFAVGLMGLVFYSGRSGHDERVVDPEDVVQGAKPKNHDRKVRSDWTG